MSLHDHTKNHLAKLKLRLSKQGISCVEDMDYEKYLNTKLWKEIKQYILDRDDNCCLVCLKEKYPGIEFDVHHREYDRATMEGKDDSKLVTLCRRCHKKVEYYPDGNRRTNIDEKEEELNRLIALHREIEEKGLALHIISQKKRVNTKYIITYVGPEKYLEFYKLDNLISTLYINFLLKYKNKLRINRRYSTASLKQKTGVRITDNNTNKAALKAKVAGNIGEIIKLNEYEYSQQKFLDVINNNRYWYVEVSFNS